MRVLMNKGTPLEECRVIAAFGSIILDKPLQFAHPIGTNIGRHQAYSTTTQQHDPHRKLTPHTEP